MNTAIENPDIRSFLVNAGPELGDEARKQVLSLKESAASPLLAILQDHDLLDAEGDEAYAPMHAARLLADLGAESAIEPMLFLLQEIDPLDFLYSTIETAIVRFGSASVEPCLRYYERTRGDSGWLCTILGQLGVRDERIYQILLAELEEDPERAAGCLADYGDPCALPALHRAFAEAEPSLDRGLLADQDLVELEGAILHLGGELTPHEQTRIERVRDSRRQLSATLGVPSPYERAAAKRGRNQPCWCESGRKYKKCHMRSDEDERLEWSSPP